MKAQRLWIAWAWGVISVVLLLWLAGGSAAQPPAAEVTALSVCPSGCSYSSIQEAVDAASPGAVIKVAEGTYMDLHVHTAPGGYKGPVNVNQILYISKTVTVRGGYGSGFGEPPDPQAHPTVLDANGYGRVLFIAGDVSPVIEGLQMTGGRATGQGGSVWTPQGDWDWRDAGGGVYIVTATATLSNCQIVDNAVTSGGFGGGVYLNRAATTITGTTVQGNSAPGYAAGGGVAIWYSDATLQGNTIRQNHNSGVWLYGYAPMFRDNLIADNTSDWNGGGLDFYYGSAYLDHNTIRGNSARNGGGASLDTYSGAIMSGNVIAGNTATSNGGGLYTSWRSWAQMANDVVIDNQANGMGSGLYLNDSVLHASHTTVSRNYRGGGEGLCVDSDSTAAMTNTILVSHTLGITITGSGTATLQATLWGAGSWGNDTDSGGRSPAIGEINIHAAPGFAADGYHLTAESAAIDQGLDAGLSADIDRELRDALPDLGADEYWAPDFAPPTFPDNDPATGSPLITPTLGVTVSTAFPLFDWTSATDDHGVLGYALVLTGGTPVAGDALAQEATTVFTTSESSYTPTLPLPDGVYTWTVRAFDGVGNYSAAIAPQHFVVSAWKHVYLSLVLRNRSP
jgi:hypothetical protein